MAEIFNLKNTPSTIRTPCKLNLVSANQAWVYLSAKKEIAQLGKSEENDEEHEAETKHIFGALE